MIDDDFQNIFRKMIEQFFGSEMGIPKGTDSVGFRIQPRNENMTNLNSQNNMVIEKIELEDETLLLVDNIRESDKPNVTVKGSDITIEITGENPEILTTSIEYQPDPDTSFMHITNGVLEVTLRKLNKQTESITDSWNVKIS